MTDSFPYPETHSNIGGCNSFYFIPASLVELIVISSATNKVASLELSPQGEFLKGFASYKSLAYEEKSTLNDPGQVFLAKITGFYPRQSSQMLGILTRMSSEGLIAAVKDNNMQLRLVGNLQTPLHFSFNQVTGKSPAQRNGYEFTFRAELLSPSPFIDPDMLI